MREPSDSLIGASDGELPPIPGKRYFTIGEVSELCGVKPHVLRYWEQEFPQLKPVKRRGNRRYYQRHDVLMVRQIRNLLYEQGSPSAVHASSSAARAPSRISVRRIRFCDRCGLSLRRSCMCFGVDAGRLTAYDSASFNGA
jgi:hypothetical protein